MSKPEQELARTPAVFTRHLNRRVSVQNNSLASDWDRTRAAIEREKARKESRLDVDRAEWMNYSKQIRVTTGRLHEDEQVSLPVLEDARFRRTSSARKHGEPVKNSTPNHPVPPDLTRTTSNSEHKRMSRRMSSLILFELQNNKDSFISQVLNIRKRSTTDNTLPEMAVIQEDTKSHLSLQEGDELPIKLPPLALLRLPRVYTIGARPVQPQTFERDDSFVKKATGQDIKYEEIKFCRYLRVPRNRKVVKYRTNTI
ncbi:predicted protein [Nematostella vectensis]|uniref:Uncharacterized protein n=2 Tax=Nematostella vectensis TaxID=45351 RepID=A7S879_NEMVE|nr:predicted protein [Nematostella vectensis]|eukprot:XP_001632080.1 predicted protein [Nematostella vectensis]